MKNTNYLTNRPTGNDLISTLDYFFNDSLGAFSPFLQDARKLLAPVSSKAAAYHNVEWYEEDENYFAVVELPGVKREDLNLAAEDGLLQLSYVKRTRPFIEDKPEASDDAEKEEQKRTPSELILRIPEGISTSEITARLEDGILHLKLPKQEEKKPISVQVN